MEQLQLSKIITKLRFAYPYFFKDLSKEEVIGMYGVYQEQLKEFNYETVNNAIDNLIKKNKYMPSIAEIVEYCNEYVVHKENEVVSKMIKDGYFKSSIEIDKANMWIEKGIIPSWFKEEMRKYYTKQLNDGIRQLENAN